MISDDDTLFLASLRVCGIPPTVYRSMGTVQWNLSGMNFKDQCFQAVVHEVQGKPTITLQVFRSSSAHDSTQPSDCIPLGTLPYLKTRETQLAVERMICRWGGLRRDAFLYPDPWSFRTWIEGVESQPATNLTTLMKLHFGEFGAGDGLDTQKVQSFFSLPKLRELVGDEQVRSVVTLFNEVSRKKKQNLTYQWLMDALGGQL